VGKKSICLLNVLFVIETSALNIDFQKAIHALMLLQELHLDLGKQKSADSNPKNYRHFPEEHHYLALLSVQNAVQTEQ